MQPSLNSLISRRAGADRQGEVMEWRNQSAACRGCWGRFWPASSSPGSAATAPISAHALVIGAAFISWRLPPAEPAASRASPNEPVQMSLTK